jgi:hypothetical protein
LDTVPDAKKSHLVSMADFPAEVLAGHALATSDKRPRSPHDVLFGYDRLGWHAFLAMLHDMSGLPLSRATGDDDGA